MTNRRNGLIVGLAVAVVGIASVAIGIAAYLNRLPDPQTADRRGLFRWLVECDLRQEPVETKLVILQRMEGELLKGIDFREIASMLNDQQRRKLLENADLLANLWFRRQSDCYFGAAASDRPNLLGEQIGQIHRLGIMDQLSAIENWPAGSSSKSGTSTEVTPVLPAAALSSMAAQLKRIERWLAEADPGERPRLAEYFAALRDRMIWDGIQSAGSVRNWLPL
jgi:hypothetical protein